MHRRPPRPAAKAVFRALVACVAVAGVGGGCVLRHPADPATPAALAWAKAYGPQVVQLQKTAYSITDLQANSTPDGLVSSLTQSCQDLEDQANAAAALPKIPSHQLQAQWASGLNFMRVAAKGCLQSLDPDSTSSTTANTALRTASISNAAYGEIRIGVVVTFLSVSATPTTAAAPATTAAP